MGSKINIGDSWKTVSAIKLNIGDVWKNAENSFINIGDSWKKYYRLSGITYTPTANTKGYYKFDNNGLDSSGSGYHLTSGTTKSFLSDGLLEESVLISGISYAWNASDKVIPSGQKNISFWIYNIGGNADFSGILSNNLLFTATTGTTIYISSNVNIGFQIRGGGPTDASSNGLYTLSLSNAIPVGVWTHIVCQWNGTSNANSGKIYKNGELAAQSTNSKTENEGATYNLYIGRQAYTPYTYAGYFYLDEIIIENVVWTADEVRNYYNKYRKI
jgi:hypothetical protein